MDKKYFESMLDKRIGKDDPHWKYDHVSIDVNKYPKYLYKYRKCNYIGFESLAREIMETTPLSSLDDRNNIYLLLDSAKDKDKIRKMIWAHIGYLVYYYLPPVGNTAKTKLGHEIYYYQINQSRYFDKNGDFKAEKISSVLPSEFKQMDTMTTLGFLVQMQQFEKEKMKDNSTFESIVKKLADIFHNECKLFCMSENKDNKHLWDEYADGTKGFVVEYDLSNWNKATLANLFPVEYVEDTEIDLSPLVAECAQDDIYGFVKHNNPVVKQIYKTMFMKDKKDADEKEWRLESSEMQVHAKISAIYVGKDVSKEDKEKLRKICEENNIVIKEYTE